VTYNGHAWTAPQPIDSQAELWSVSCPTATFCAAVDTAGNAVTYNGSTWTVGAQAPTGGAGLESISCPNAGLCVAASFGGGVFTLKGGAWKLSVTVSQQQTLRAVSCPADSFCAAVAQGGDGIIGN